MKYVALALTSLTLALAQSVVAVPVSSVAGATGVPEYVVQGGLVVFVLWFWRQDRADRALERVEAAKQYSTLAEDFRKIVVDNTAALVSLRDSISRQTNQGGIPAACPALVQADASKG